MSKSRSEAKVCGQIDSFLSPAAKRVAVARDALAWLRAGALQAETGAYVTPTNEAPFFYLDDHRQMRDAVFGETTVCALGALFIAHIVRFDHCTVSEYITANGRSMSNFIEDKLKDTFDLLALGFIESAFERCDMTSSSYVTQKEIDAAVAFGKRYRKDRDRLEAILRNIVRNNGDFRFVRRSYRAVAQANS
jgi:hypothetical protein